MENGLNKFMSERQLEEISEIFIEYNYTEFVDYIAQDSLS